ncbi:NYN domain-containing protein [Neisseria sp. Ec49-e6-T10]
MSSEQSIDSESKLKFAVLIDGDNAQAEVIGNLLAEIAKYGVVTLKRVYGDFSEKSCWNRDVLLKYAIQPQQQFAFTKGKNATDSLLIIDAMDLLYSKNFDGFCLVSSDSDFTSLAIRLREEGLLVYGFGEKKTPEAFRNACDRFIFTEILRNEVPHIENKVEAINNKKEKESLPKEFFLQALEEAGDEQGWANLGTFGQYLQKIKPDFDARLYGYKKLSELVKSEQAKSIFMIQGRKNNAQGKTIIYIKARKQSK